MASSALASNPASNVFKIVVLEGPLSTSQLMSGADIGTVALEGRALPYRPIAFEGEQRSKTTYYAGNTVGTQSVMGAVDKNTTVNGVWKDKFLGDGNAILLANTLDTIMRSGALIRVEWQNAPASSLISSITREGILKRFKTSLDRFQDVTWEAEFEWRGRGEPVAPPTLSISAQNPRDSASVMADSMQTVLDDTSSFLDDVYTRMVQVDFAVRDKMDTVQNTIAGVIYQVDSIATELSSLASIPENVLERSINLCNLASTATRDLEQSLLDVEESLYLVKDTAVDALNFLGGRLGIMQNSTASRETAINTAASFAGLLFPDVIAEIRPSAGTSLRDLAQKYYGDPELWWLIAKYNGIQGSVVPPSPDGLSDATLAFRAIGIPRRQAGALGDLRAGC